MQKARKWGNDNTEAETFIYRPNIVVGDSKTGKTTGFSGYYTYMRTYHIIKMMLERKSNGMDRDFKFTA